MNKKSTRVQQKTLEPVFAILRSLDGESLAAVAEFVEMEKPRRMAREIFSIGSNYLLFCSRTGNTKDAVHVPLHDFGDSLTVYKNFVEVSCRGQSLSFKKEADGEISISNGDFPIELAHQLMKSFESSDVYQARQSEFFQKCPRF